MTSPFDNLTGPGKPLKAEPPLVTSTRGRVPAELTWRLSLQIDHALISLQAGRGAGSLPKWRAPA